MSPLIPVMTGGALGAGARWVVGSMLLARLGSGFPWGTLTVNLVGGLAMGILAGTLARTGADEGWRLLLGVGVLGGFTTFSAFGLEIWAMLARGDGLLATGYALASVIGAVGATGIGATLVRAL